VRKKEDSKKREKLENLQSPLADEKKVQTFFFSRKKEDMVDSEHLAEAP
jgi:hypothetical protein